MPTIKEESTSPPQTQSLSRSASIPSCVFDSNSGASESSSVSPLLLEDDNDYAGADAGFVDGLNGSGNGDGDRDGDGRRRYPGYHRIVMPDEDSGDGDGSGDDEDEDEDELENGDGHGDENQGSENELESEDGADNSSVDNGNEYEEEIIEVEMNIEEMQQVVNIASIDQETEEEAENDSGSTTESEDFYILNAEGTPIPRTRENIMAVAEARIKKDMQDAHYKGTPDPSPLIKFFAIGADMCEYYMLKICPDAELIGIARLDDWMYCVDADVEDVCCYQNLLPLDTNAQAHASTNAESEYNTRGKVIYGLLWEIHENTIYELLSMDKPAEAAQLGMARVDVVRLECEKGFGPAFAFGMGWGLKRRLREVGVEVDVVTFTGKPGGMGLGEGYNEWVNRGIVEACMRGVPDEWVESDVRIWVQYPSLEEPVLLK